MQCKLNLKTIKQDCIVDSISNLLKNNKCDKEHLKYLLPKPY